jgi:hypothetical protein
MIAGGAGLFFLVRAHGERLTTPSGPPAVVGASGAAAVAPLPNTVFHALLTLAVVIVVGRFLGQVLQAIGQPPVVGEVVATTPLLQALGADVARRLVRYNPPATC